MEANTIEDQTAELVAARRGRPPKAAAPIVQADVAEVVHKTAAELAPPRFFPVKMTRNYRPIKPFLVNGKEPTAEQSAKVPAGQEIEMDIEEAKDIIARGIASRNDPIG